MATENRKATLADNTGFTWVLVRLGPDGARQVVRRGRGDPPYPVAAPERTTLADEAPKPQGRCLWCRRRMPISELRKIPSACLEYRTQCADRDFCLGRAWWEQPA